MDNHLLIDTSLPKCRVLGVPGYKGHTGVTQQSQGNLRELSFDFHDIYRFFPHRLIKSDVRTTSDVPTRMWNLSF